MSKKKKKKFHTQKNNFNTQKSILIDDYLQNTETHKKIIPIKGMHCRSCEILISEKLKELPEIKNVSVNYKKSEALIYSRVPLDVSVVSRAVEEAGYEVGVDDSKSWISKNPEEYYDLIKAAIILLILYLFAKKFGLFNINTGSNNPSGLLVVWIIGLTAGLSTCMALVGGLILGIAARHSEKHPEATSVQKFRPHIFFNIGRIGSYFLLGGVIGLIGKAFQLSGTTLGLLTIAVGLVMFVLGLQLTELFPKVSSGGLTLPTGISRFLGIKKHHDKEYSHINSVVVGALTFFLPCGFTQAMQLFAMSTGSFWQGAAIMGVFALGTAPGLLGVGGLTSIVKGAFAKKFFKFAGLLVVTLSLLNISNGYNLTGWGSIFPRSQSVLTTEAKNDPNVVLENGVQVVRMTQSPGGYAPNKFIIKKGIPVKWIIKATNIDVCSGSIMSTKLGIRKYLNLGENVFEFTPQETGEIKFSCSMGMYSGKFIVVEGGQSSQNDSGNKAIEKPKDAPPPPAPITESQPKTDTTKPKTPTSSENNNSLPPAQPADDVQVIKTTFFSPQIDIDPNKFTVKSGKPVRFEIEAEADGEGCMGSVTIPGLVDGIPQFFNKGETIKFEFTPTKPGTYQITCGMGVPRGTIIVT